MIIILNILLGILIFGLFQSICFAFHGTTPVNEAAKVIHMVTCTSRWKRYIAGKQIQLTKLGADLFLSEGITVSRYYLYKILLTVSVTAVTLILTMAGGTKPGILMLIILISFLAWFFPDLYLRSCNNRSNERMLEDIMEMSRSVLYGKRGGQYIGDALRDATMVVENRRLKASLIAMAVSLDAGVSLEEALYQMELHFQNAEISSFCTVIRSLQATGQVDEALRTLEHSIEREQISVNKRRCVMLENTTLFFVMLIAVDLLAVILYCIVSKLMAMEMNF